MKGLFMLQNMKTTVCEHQLKHDPRTSQSMIG